MKTDQELLDCAIQDGWYSYELPDSGEVPITRWYSLSGESENQWATIGDWMSPVLRRVLQAKYDKYAFRNQVFGL